VTVRRAEGRHQWPAGHPLFGAPVAVAGGRTFEERAAALAPLVRAAAVVVPVADRLGHVPHIHTSLDAALSGVHEGGTDFKTGLDLALTSAYRQEVERQFDERLGDLANWEPTGFLGAAKIEPDLPPTPTGQQS